MRAIFPFPYERNIEPSLYVKSKLIRILSEKVLWREGLYFDSRLVAARTWGCVRRRTLVEGSWKRTRLYSDSKPQRQGREFHTDLVGNHDWFHQGSVVSVEDCRNRKFLNFGFRAVENKAGAAEAR